MKKNRFSTCASNYIDCLRKEGRYSTAHVYKNAVRSFSQFCGTQSIEFTKINRENLKRYSNYLTASRLKPNTISTYMRMLRCIYNRGVVLVRLRMYMVCFVMCLPELIPARRKHFLWVSFIRCLTKIRRRRHFAIRRPLLIYCFSLVVCLSLIWLIWRSQIWIRGSWSITVWKPVLPWVWRL